MTELQKLIILLEEIQKAYNISVIRGQKGMHSYLNPENSLVDEVSDKASDVLFNRKGRLNFEVKLELQRIGYKITLLEGHELGWLICGLEIPRKGILVFYNNVLLDEIEENGEEI